MRFASFLLLASALWLAAPDAAADVSPVLPTPTVTTPSRPDAPSGHATRRPFLGRPALLGLLAALFLVLGGAAGARDKLSKSQ